jgi:hypothetical protein
MRRTLFAGVLLAAASAAALPALWSYRAAAGEPAAAAPARYQGKYCEGTGDVAYLRLIDESFCFFHPEANVPNLTMVYQPTWNSFTEGAGWGAWWIQNSYGFSYCAIPFLQEPWVTVLQNSQDFFFDNIGDGKRMGLWGGSPTANHLSALVGPDGCLGDAALPGQIAYKQGDGDARVHDWFYEATAAGVVMQAELLLVGRDPAAIGRYIGRMERSCNFIETARDPKNNLFLVGPACNLLAPSYGGVKQPDGKFGKGYLAGLSITYAAAADRMAELFQLLGQPEKAAEYRRRAKITRESLPGLLAPAGYLVKSVEPDGTKHGVVGQKQYGYLEGVANVDAVALRVADDALAATIYRQIASFPEIRPFDFLLTNAPGLDDTYVGWGRTELGGFFKFGDWVNGGVWGTVEGRAILAYSRLGKVEDVRRSADRAMKWSKDFRMDAPWSQRGENTNNPWYKEQPVALMIDNFAIPAATIRGLFEYLYRADSLVLIPRVPPTILEYRQKEPIRFGSKRLLLAIANGGNTIRSVKVNGKDVAPAGPDRVVLAYNDLPQTAEVAIVTDGGWPAQAARPVAPPEPAASAASPQAVLPESLKRPFAVLTAMGRLLDPEADAAMERAFVRESLQAIDAWRRRTAVEPQGFFRPMTPEKRAAILNAYETAALNMYGGLAGLMQRYAQGKDPRKNAIAKLFGDAQRAAK